METRTWYGTSYSLMVQTVSDHFSSAHVNKTNHKIIAVQNQKHTIYALRAWFWPALTNKLWGWRHDMPPPLSSHVGAQVACAPPSRCNVGVVNIGVVSHTQYVLTVIAAPASSVKVTLSKAAWWPWPLTLKLVSESCVTWATSVPILIFLGLSVLVLGPMYATDRRQREASLTVPAY